MKSIIYFFVMIACLQNTLYAQYCTPSYSSGCSLDAIQYFSLKGEPGTTIYNNSGTCTVSYTNYTGTFSAVNLSIGLSYSGFLRTQDPNNYVSIWIDQNNNNSFESTEQILNNLQIGSTNTLYSIFIPQTFALGIHRMRVRNIYSGSTPVSPTDPCNLYTYGETEDYNVNITNTPSARFVSSGTPGTCLLSSKTTIDAASNNMNANNIALLDSSNNFIIGLYPSGNNLGTVSANLYVHSASTRQAPNGNYYLNRNIKINSSNAPTTTYNSRMYYKTTELNSLIAQPGSGVTSQFDLFAYKNSDACSASLNDQFGSNIYPTGYGSISSDKFLDFSGITGLGNFYFTAQNLTATCLPPLSPSVTLSSSTSGIFHGATRVAEPQVSNGPLTAQQPLPFLVLLPLRHQLLLVL
ncbi:MAG: hypothetical protein IPI46_04260 [Bacteroidetes bacterium]|nr:hypothetical protein [Bacteroidota bacterium]